MKIRLLLLAAVAVQGADRYGELRRAIRMATADVLADLGAAGRDAVSARLKAVSKTDYRPILQYPHTDRERAAIRACR